MFTPARGESDINLEGLNASVHHSDNYITNYKNASRMQHVTYLNWIQTKETPEDKGIALKIPGDISDRAKAEGMEVPWKKIITSYTSVATISILSVGVLLTWLLWRKVISKSKANQ